jgi:small-conductance mechanosensitive channel
MNVLSKWFNDSFGHAGVHAVETQVIRYLAAVIVLLAAFWISRVLQRTAERRLGQGDQSDDGAIRAYKRIIGVVVLVPGALVAIHLMGVNLSSVFTTGGLFAVAMAFALKNVAENFVSGIMLRFERAIKPGDVLETEGTLVRVKKIGLRATIVRSKDEKDLLIPNSQLVQNRVANFTYRDAVCRVSTAVGVSYDSDPGMVREVLESVCDRMEGRSDQHPPQVLLMDFGSSSVDYRVSVWIANPWGSGKFRSTLNESIWRALNEAGITIAFPQLDVHFDGENQTLPLNN